MGKVIFEFDENDIENINLVVNRHKLICAIEELSELYRGIYNHKIYYRDDEQIYLKADGTKATDEDYKKANLEGKFLEGGKHYLSQDYIERELDNILSDVRQYLY
jgi:hypothetical protein